MAETRKLAAILAADVVGFSRLAGADEDRTLARLRALRSDLIDPTIAVHNGRMVKRTGDGVLVEFRSVVDAVRCAIEVQNAMVERNAGVSEDRRIAFRIGVHLGDVVEEADGDLMGDGVNIAARLEGIAKPGAICLSEDAYRQVKGRLDLAVTDLGPTALKNIAEPVRAYSVEVGVTAAPRKRRPVAALIALAVLLLFGTAVGAWRYLGPRPTVAEAAPALTPPTRLSIVVLPFANLSGDASQDYLADAITEDLTTDLSHLPDSFVIARNTAFTYKGKAIDVKQLGRELGVRYVLEGSVRQLGEKITANVQLISAETGAHLWADRFAGERNRLGDLQVEFVTRLANSLGVELVKAESLRSMRDRPNNPDAIDLVMRGRAALGRGVTIGNIDEAAADFERALQLDPALTRAQVGLARTLYIRLNFFRNAQTTALEQAESLIARALSAEPNDAETHYVKAGLMVVRKQFEGTLAEAKEAIENDRNFATAYSLYGGTHVFVGKTAESISYNETALRLSPRDPFRNVWEGNICVAHSHLAEWEQAIEWCEKSIASNGAFWLPWVDLIAAYGWLGREREAKAAIAGLLKLKPGFTVKSYANFNWSDNPTFLREYARVIEGLRKAGMPEE